MVHSCSTPPCHLSMTSKEQLLWTVGPEIWHWVCQGKQEAISSMTKWHSSKLSCRATALRVCMPFWRLNIFTVQLAQGLFSCWKNWKILLTDGEKNNFSWTSPETRFFWKLKEDRVARGHKYLLYTNTECFFWVSFYLVMSKNSNWLIRAGVHVMGGAGQS